MNELVITCSILSLVFCIFYGIDGVLRERGFEVLAVPIAIIVVLLYLIANFSVYHSPENFAIKLVNQHTHTHTLQCFLDLQTLYFTCYNVYL